LSAVFAMYMALNFYQSQIMLTLAPSANTAGANAAGAANNKPMTEAELALKKKADFIKTVDALLSQPSLSTEAKTQLVQNYADIFGSSTEKIEYKTAIGSFYRCQKSFYEDALKAMKSKKFVKSEDRLKCHSEKGLFFNRDLLVPTEVAKNDDTVIETLAQGKPIMHDGKEVKVDQKSLEDGVAAQKRYLSRVDEIFE
jgi:hypothetical protein